MTQETAVYKVSEGIHGTWFYHLSTNEHSTLGLCGARTMHTSVPLSAWGGVGHLNERYCKECEKLANLGDRRGN